MLKDNLMMLRNIHGFSQEEIAAKVGVSRQAYAKWENGSTVPDIEKCRRLAEIYGILIDSLVNTQTADGIGVIPPPPKGKNIWGSVTIGERGQIIIPKAARDQFHLTSGQRLIVLTNEEGIALIPAEVFENAMQSVMSFGAFRKTATKQ